MREKYGKDLDMGTYTEQMLVGYDDPAIEFKVYREKLKWWIKYKEKEKT